MSMPAYELKEVLFLKSPLPHLFGLCGLRGLSLVGGFLELFAEHGM